MGKTPVGAEKPVPVGPPVGPAPGPPVPVGRGPPVTKGGEVGPSELGAGLGPFQGRHGFRGPRPLGPSKRFMCECSSSTTSSVGHGTTGGPPVGMAVPEGTMPVGNPPVGKMGSPPLPPVGPVGNEATIVVVPEGRW